jgi:CBS-domain-containing membrane protein
MSSNLSNFRYLIHRRFSRIRTSFPRLWKHYLLQSLAATVVIFIVLLSLALENAVVIASIGATAFIVFTMPRSVTATPRRVIGGHVTGLIAGLICAAIPHNSTIAGLLVYSLAVGIAICGMVTLDFEHPPAAGTALGVAITGFSPGVVAAVITSSIIMSLAHRFGRKYLRDLV